MLIAFRIARITTAIFTSTTLTLFIWFFYFRLNIFTDFIWFFFFIYLLYGSHFLFLFLIHWFKLLLGSNSIKLSYLKILIVLLITFVTEHYHCVHIVDCHLALKIYWDLLYFLCLVFWWLIILRNKDFSLSGKLRGLRFILRGLHICISLNFGSVRIILSLLVWNFFF